MVDIKTIKWPDHKKQGSASCSDFATFYPNVADAMRAQGMDSIKQLTDRVQWIMDQAGMKELFGDIQPSSLYISRIISRNDKGKAALFSKQNGYTNGAVLVAMALETDVEDLFGRLGKRYLSFDAHKGHFENHMVDPVQAQVSQKNCVDTALDFIEAHSSINHRASNILSRHFGLLSHEETLVAIAQDMGISRGRAQDIRNSAFKAMKSDHTAELLKTALRQPLIDDFRTVPEPE